MTNVSTEQEPYLVNLNSGILSASNTADQILAARSNGNSANAQAPYIPRKPAQQPRSNTSTGKTPHF